MNKIKVSIIVPVYNVESYLRRCLDSLINQTLEEIEIICVNDKSPDNSIEILKEYEKKYPHKVIVINSTVNKRQGGARNLGMRKARGEYIGFVDGDDWVREDMYEVLYSNSLSATVDCVGCNLIKVTDGKEEVLSQFSDFIDKEENDVYLDYEIKGKLISFPGSVVTKIYKRELLIENSLFFPENLFYEDNYFNPIVALHLNSFKAVKDSLYYYNQNNITSTTSRKNSNHHLDRIKTAEMLWFKFSELDRENEYEDSLEYLFTELYYIHTVSTLLYYYDEIDYSKIKEIRSKFLSKYPFYYMNKFYQNEFSSIKRAIFRINDYNVHIYAIIYRVFRKLKG